MEIRYKRCYAPAGGKRYTAGEINAMLGYAVEIADPRVVLEEGKLAPGEVCLLLFGIAPEEYALKDEKPKELDTFVELLARNVPADRLISWRILNLKGEQVQRSIRPRMQRESMDEGAFARRVRASQAGPIDEQLLEARRLQRLCAEKDAPDGVKQDWTQARRALGEALLGLEKIYAAEEALLGGKWPAVGFDARIELFTTRKRAERIMPQVAAAHGGVDVWKIREIPAGEIETYLRRCSADGLNLLRMDNGFAAAELQIGDFMEIAKGENIAVRNHIIREIEAGIRWNQMKEAGVPEEKLRGALEGALTLRNLARREIGNAMLYAVCMDGVRGRCIIMGKKDAGDKMLAVFTDGIQAAAFAERIDGNPVPVAMSFDELASCARNNGCDLVIDGNALAYRIPAKEFDMVKELRAKPPMVVRIQPQQKRAEAAPDPKKEGEELGGLPDPDAFDVPLRAQQEAPEVQREPASEEDAPKKGFFRKLFGK